jgi:beta-glucosidase
VTDPVCPPGTAFAATVAAIDRGELDAEAAVADLLTRLTDDELLGMLDGDRPFLRGFLDMVRRYNGVPIEAGRIDRLGIPGVRFTDGPRGVVVGSSTAFPVPIARAASFNPELERRIGDAIGAEARAQGANLFAGICINLAHAPGWGRSQESYGEDPLLLGAMGAALNDGVQPWVLSCVKHYALNSMEEARFRVDVRVDDDVLHEVYLPHFRTVVEAGVDAVMSAYNRVNGTWAGEHPYLLTEVLREDWGFTGFVMSDFIWGLRAPVGSVTAGLDLEMPFRQQRAAALPPALADGRLARADVEQAAARLLHAQVTLALRARPTPGIEVIASPKHRALAREAAHHGTVLLRNASIDGVPALPLDEPSLRRLAVVGPQADRPVEGDIGSSQVFPPDRVTVLDGLRERLGDRVVRPDGIDADAAGTDADAAVAVAGAALLARDADAAVVVVGLTSRDEGESMVGVDTATTRLFGGIARWRPVAAVLSTVLGRVAERRGWGGDRRDLRLHADDVALIRAIAAVNPRTIVVVIGGGTVVVDPWDTQVAGVLLAWYPGMEGGHAIADLLLGDAEPGGRLPHAIPHRAEDLPVLDWDADTVRYSRWSGQRHLDRAGIAAAYPFGFGLSYTTFQFRDLQAGPVEGERFDATVTVANTGARPGRQVVQIYAVEDVDGGRAVRVLVGFQSVHLQAGDEHEVTVGCSTRPLQRWGDGTFNLVARHVDLEAASYAGDPDAVTTTVTLAPETNGDR